MKHIKLFENFDKDTLEKELEKYGIWNYTIDEDGMINVNDDVYLAGKHLNKIPFKFGKVTGDFNLGANNLTSLEGCPYYVGGIFNCSYNQLINLIGGPEEVDRNYICHSNKLISLEGIAAEIGGYLDCENNELTDLNISSNIGKYLCCKNNKIDPKNYQFHGDLGGKIYFSYDEEE